MSTRNRQNQDFFCPPATGYEPAIAGECVGQSAWSGFTLNLRVLFLSSEACSAEIRVTYTDESSGRRVRITRGWE